MNCITGAAREGSALVVRRNEDLGRNRLRYLRDAMNYLYGDLGSLTIDEAGDGTL